MTLTPLGSTERGQGPERPGAHGEARVMWRPPPGGHEEELVQLSLWRALPALWRCGGDGQRAKKHSLVEVAVGAERCCSGHPPPH